MRTDKSKERIVGTRRAAMKIFKQHDQYTLAIAEEIFNVPCAS